jgi:hypothetical protein
VPSSPPCSKKDAVEYRRCYESGCSSEDGGSFTTKCAHYPHNEALVGMLQSHHLPPSLACPSAGLAACLHDHSADAMSTSRRTLNGISSNDYRWELEGVTQEHCPKWQYGAGEEALSDSYSCLKEDGSTAIADLMLAYRLCRW